MPKTCCHLLAVLLITVTEVEANDQAAAPTAALEASDSPPVTEAREKNVKPGINERFLDPDLDVSEWLGRFEIESREVYAARNAVLKILDIRPGMSVADIGAGTGFYTRLFADAAGPTGNVAAVDIAAKFLAHIEQRAKEESIVNINTVLCTERSVNLPPKSIDRAFICDTYHHFEYPQATLTSLLRAMKPGATLVVIDFERIPGKSSEWIMGHVRAGKAVFREEIETAGFEFLEEVQVDQFEDNYLLRFRRP